MIDYVFNLIINNSEKIPRSFYELINKLEFNYQKEMIEKMQPEKVQMIKEIIYILYELEKEDFKEVLEKVKRNELINLYEICKKYDTDDFLLYYKRAVINKYSNTS